MYSLSLEKRCPTVSNRTPRSIRHRQPRAICALAGTLLLTCVAAWAQLPPNWADQDIGTPSQTGSASFANGVWTVAGGGADIWTAADQFHFAYEPAGDSMVLIAHVTGVQNSDPWAKVGVMLRDSVD